LKKIKQYIDFQ